MFASWEMPWPCKSKMILKVISPARAKAQHEWDKLVTIAQHCPPFLKLTLVKLTSKQLLQVLGLNV